MRRIKKTFMKKLSMIFALFVVCGSILTGCNSSSVNNISAQSLSIENISDDPTERMCSYRSEKSNEIIFEIDGIEKINSNVTYDGKAYLYIK